MKTIRAFSIILILAMFGAALLGFSWGKVHAGFELQPGRALQVETALGTAFTYQGQLKQGEQAVTGTCDFQFDLWDASSAGNQVGSLVVPGLAVSGGLFTASLDFGAAAFNGQALWLEVSVVCPTGGGSLTSLGRQALTAAPYALRALDAGQLNGQPASYYQRRVSAACTIGSAIRAINADGTVVCEPFRAFTRNPLDTAGIVGEYSSITIGSDGLGLISYYDLSNGDLKVVRCYDTACTTVGSIATVDSAGDVGSHSAIAIGSDGLGLISYLDVTNRDLKVAHCNDAACTSATITTLDSVGVIGGYTSLAIGADGLGLISYYHDSNGDLKVAHCDNLACTSATITTLDSAGVVGVFTSLTIGMDDLGLISYYDVSNGDLKVAHCANTACTSAVLHVVDSAGDVGSYSSIAIGGDELGLISYRDLSNKTLKVAHCEDTECATASTYTLSNPAGLGYGDTSIIIGAGWLGLIVYYDTLNYDLKVARCENEVCSSATINTLDSPGDVGSNLAIIQGRDGMGLISYFDNSNGNLKVIHCDDYWCEP